MRITSLSLPVADLEAQRHFYSSVLGLTSISDSNKRCVMRAGRSTLTLVAGDPADGQHFAFHIAENLVEAAFDWIAGRATLLPEDGQLMFEGCFGRDSHHFYFGDAENNVLEFIAYHDTATASQPPFGPSRILEVGEVGLVSADAMVTAAALGKWLGVEARGDEGFSIAGDREGMLVIVKSGRPWHDGERPAIATAMSVRVDSVTPQGEAPPLTEPWGITVEGS